MHSTTLRHSLPLLALLALPAHGQTLQQVFEKAWSLAPQARVVEARRGEAEASRLQAGSLLADAPRISIGQRSDRWNDDRGKREEEIGLSLPLWLPAQKSARSALADADLAEQKEATAATRLLVAGELRQALWNLLLARQEASLAEQRLKLLRALEADVARRVKVGELARTDLLLASQESAAAQGTQLDAEARVLRAAQRYRVLTGSEALPGDPHEALREPPAPHPRLAAAQAGSTQARAGLQLAQTSTRDAPSLGVQMRRERDVYGAAQRDSVGFTFTLPLATEARNAPQIARANTALIDAESRLQRLQAEIEAEQQEATHWLATSRQALQLAEAREQAASERLLLLKRSFTLGEAPLPELLRAQAAASEAGLELARAKVRLSAAHAALNQARGITP